MKTFGTMPASVPDARVNGLSDTVIAEATVGTGISKCCEATPGDWTQHEGTAVAGCDSCGQQLWDDCCACDI